MYSEFINENCKKCYKPFEDDMDIWVDKYDNYYCTECKDLHNIDAVHIRLYRDNINEEEIEWQE